MERSIQPLLVACPKNLLTCKFVTSQVVEWTFLQIPEESGLSILRVKGFHSLLRRHSFWLACHGRLRRRLGFSLRGEPKGRLRRRLGFSLPVIETLENQPLLNI